MHRRIARGQIELACVELGDVGEEASGGAPLSRRRGGEGVLQPPITQMRERVVLHGDTQRGRVPGAIDTLFLSRPFHELWEPALRDNAGLDEKFSTIDGSWPLRANHARWWRSWLSAPALRSLACANWSSQFLCKVRSPVRSRSMRSRPELPARSTARPFESPA